MTRQTELQAEQLVAIQRPLVLRCSAVNTADCRTEDHERGCGVGRLAVLGILVGIGLTVGFGLGGAIWFRVVVGLAAFALAAFLTWWRPVRKRLMAFMHWLTRE